MPVASGIKFVTGSQLCLEQTQVAILSSEVVKVAVCFSGGIILSTQLFAAGSCDCDIMSHYSGMSCCDSLPDDLPGQFARYFSGEPLAFRATLVSPTSAFVRRVYDSLLSVGYGQTISYARLAELAGHANAARAVGSAMRNNPYPIIIPCHRVIRSDGKSGSYSGGLGIATKEYLLNLEQRSGR